MNIEKTKEKILESLDGISVDHDEFEGGIVLIEAIYGAHQFNFECRPYEKYGVSYFYDDGEPTLGSYRFRYYESFDDALEKLIDLIKSKTS